MGNVLRILRRDILRLLKAPAALVVVGVLMVLPSLYTWYNVLAFWNPYEATGNLSVSVVNQDAGAETELTGQLNVGDTVTEALLENEKLNFAEEDFDTAMTQLEGGDVFAVYVIPEDFTECLISPLTGQVKSPQIVYYANEKLGPVSPRITDTASSTLDQTINSMFVSTVSESAAQAIDSAIGDARTAKDAAQEKATTSADAALTAIADVRAKLKDAQTALDDARAKTESASASLDDARLLVGDARTLVNDTANEAYAVEDALLTASSGAVGSLSGVATELSQVTAKAKNATDDLLAKAGSARALVDLGTGRVQPFINTLTSVSQDMQAVASALPDDGHVKTGILDAAGNLANRAADLQSAVDSTTALSAGIEETAQAASNVAGTLDSASKRVSDSLANYSGGLLGSTAPTVTTILAQVSSSCSHLSAATTDLDTTIGEAQVGLGQLGNLLANSNDALAQTDALIGDLQSDVDSITSDIHLLAQSDAIAGLVENGSLNAQNIGAFMGSPTKLETVRMYHPNAYGTAMAPLFMNLTFWIGAFMLVIIFRTEVDDEGIKKLTIGQRYVSRFALFAGIAVVQALICCTGVLALGVQVANPPALFFASAVTALAYLSIIYALSATLQHIGKALCIILVFAQIPGGSGLYPLELTDGFFQAIYPFLPFSYGIDALREAIGGFYGNFFVRDLAVLAALFVGMTVLGVVLGPVMSNVTRVAAREIREGDLYNGEDAVVPERPYRLSQIISAFSDREGFREDVERRYARFSKLYPNFIRVAIVLAIGVPVILAFMLALDAGEKVVLLTIVLLWLVALLIFVLVVESLRSSFERQLNLERMSGLGATRLFMDRNRMVPALAGAAPHGVWSGHDRARGAEPEEEADVTLDTASDEMPNEAPGEGFDNEAVGATADEARNGAADEAAGATPDVASGAEAQEPRAEGGADA